MRDDGLVEALHATGPAGPDADQLQLFGQFIGSWDIAWSGLDAAGRTHTARGELYFGWVLGGRAVQDVWIVPGRGEPGAGVPPLAFHGSTIRFYDAAIGAWRSTWMDPVNGRVRRFVGRPAGGEILLISDEDDPQLRWRFTDIRPDSFTWRGEVSRDGGATWAQDEEMRITRRGTTADGLVGALHAPGPAGLYAEELRLFDGFAGSWETAWSGRDADGRARSARGEAHFGWVLGGRAMQDLWILPRRGEPGEDGAPAFHGTWIRFYDPSIGAWRGTWMDPVNGEVLRFVVRRGRRRDPDARRRRGAALALALHRDRGGLVQLPCRVLGRWRRHLGRRRGDASRRARRLVPHIRYKSVRPGRYNAAMALNPFIWDRPLDDPSKIIGMEAFAHQVALTLKGQTNVALFGPRDTGKTTFANQLALELAKAHGDDAPPFDVVKINLQRVVSIPGFIGCVHDAMVGHPVKQLRRAAQRQIGAPGEGDRLRHQGDQGIRAGARASSPSRTPRRCTRSSPRCGRCRSTSWSSSTSSSGSGTAPAIRCRSSARR